MKNTDKISILVVEDSPSDLFLIQQGFLEVRDFEHELVAADRLSHSLELLGSRDFDVALLDLGLPDSQGLETFRKFHSKNDQLPTLILTGLNDVSVGIAALQEGAQDYLVKDRINTRLLSQAVRYALERNKLNRKLKESYERMRSLALRLQQIQEEERKRLSREVHDGLGQLLTAIKIDLNWVRKNAGTMAPPRLDIVKRIKDSEALIDRAIGSVQEIAISLRPNTLDQLGVAEAIRGEARRFQERTGINVNLDLPEHVHIGNPELATAIFRIYQELMTNIIRHANATTVQVKLDLSGEHLTLDIIDDGIGISDDAVQASNSLGLIGIFERASEHGGHVSIFNKETGGTQVSINFPISGHTALEP